MLKEAAQSHPEVHDVSQPILGRVRPDIRISNKTLPTLRARASSRKRRRFLTYKARKDRGDCNLRPCSRVRNYRQA